MFRQSSDKERHRLMRVHLVLLPDLSIDTKENGKSSFHKDENGYSFLVLTCMSHERPIPHRETLHLMKQACSSLRGLPPHRGPYPSLRRPTPHEGGLFLAERAYTL